MVENFVGKTVAANLIKGMEAVGGKIFFEEEAMTFKSHSLNIQNGDTTIFYSNITAVKKANSLGFIPNRMIVITKNGTENKFVVNKRNKLVDFLEERISNQI